MLQINSFSCSSVTSNSPRFLARNLVSESAEEIILIIYMASSIVGFLIITLLPFLNLYSTYTNSYFLYIEKVIQKSVSLFQIGHEETRLGLFAVRKLSFVSFLLREIVTHSSFLTGTAFRFASALPKSAVLLVRV